MATRPDWQEAGHARHKRLAGSKDARADSLGSRIRLWQKSHFITLKHTQHKCTTTTQKPTHKTRPHLRSAFSGGEKATNSASRAKRDPGWGSSLGSSGAKVGLCRRTFGPCARGQAVDGCGVGWGVVGERCMSTPNIAADRPAAQGAAGGSQLGKHLQALAAPHLQRRHAAQRQEPFLGQHRRRRPRRALSRAAHRLNLREVQEAGQLLPAVQLPHLPGQGGGDVEVVEDHPVVAGGRPGMRGWARELVGQVRRTVGVGLHR